MTKLNKDAYLRLIREDIEWLKRRTPPSPERDHIVTLLESEIAAPLHYGNADVAWMQRCSIVPSSPEALSIIERRHAFALRYMKEKGWGEDIDQLAIEQILEIRQQDGWKDPNR